MVQSNVGQIQIPRISLLIINQNTQGIIQIHSVNKNQQETELNRVVHIYIYTHRTKRLSEQWARGHNNKKKIIVYSKTFQISVFMAQSVGFCQNFQIIKSWKPHNLFPEIENR